MASTLKLLRDGAISSCVWTQGLSQKKPAVANRTLVRTNVIFVFIGRRIRSNELKFSYR